MVCQRVDDPATDEYFLACQKLAWAERRLREAQAMLAKIENDVGYVNHMAHEYLWKIDAAGLPATATALRWFRLEIAESTKEVAAAQAEHDRIKQLINE